MRYIPSGSVQDPAVAAELLQISRAVENLLSQTYKKVYAEPEKPRDGMVVLADGTTWNPGRGEGLYRYDESGDKWLPLEAGDFLAVTVFDDLDSTYYYYGGLDSSLEWKINRFHKTTFVKASATEGNNPTYTTLSTAWTNRTSLTYA